MNRKWTKTREDRWDADDGCVAKIDHTVECNTSRPWLLNYRGWMGYGPGPYQFNALVFKRRNSRSIVRKFKTAEAAMRAVDKEYPVKSG